MDVRSRLEGNRWTIVAVAIFLVIGTLVLVSSLSGPTSVQWTGTSVRGTDRDGIVYFSYHGQSYSLDHSSPFASTTVAFDPAHPDTTAMLEYPVERVTEVASVLVPYAIAAGIPVVVFLRRRRRRRAQVGSLADTFGSGLDPEVVRRLLEKRRGPS